MKKQNIDQNQNTTEHKSGKKNSRFICKALFTKCPVNKLEGLLTVTTKYSKNK